MKKVISFFLVMLLSMPLLAGDISPNTGIKAKDCISGKTLDFDQMLKVKHILIHQTFSGWGCMSAGSGLEKVYNKYGKNEGDFAIIAAVISDRDTKQKMISTYEQRAGVTPTFPIVLAKDGGNKLAGLFTMANYGGPTWMCHPKLFYDERISYDEATLIREIDKARADDCLTSNISLEEGYFNSEKIQIFENKLVLHIESNAQVDIKVLSLNGKVIHSQSKELNKGLNRFTLENQNFAKGIYILDIKNSSKGINFTQKVEFK